MKKAAKTPLFSSLNSMSYDCHKKVLVKNDICLHNEDICHYKRDEIWVKLLVSGFEALSMPGYYFDRLKLFDNLTPAQSALVRRIFYSMEAECGTVIFDQGDPAEFLYIIVEGEVMIQYKPDDGPMLTITRIKPEGVVGWSAALASPTYTSAAVCSTDCKLVRVRGSDLTNLCREYPETGALVLEHLANVIAKRLRNTHPTVVTLLRYGLRTGLKKHPEIEHLTS